jgi:hypothetical protein
VRVIRKQGSAAVMGSVPLYVLDEASMVLEKLEEHRRQANRAFLKERRPKDPAT